MGKKIEITLFYIAGGVFAFGWWLWIDANVYAVHINDPVKVSGLYYIPAIAATIGLIMINLVSWNDLNGSVFGEESTAKARLWLLFSFLIEFGAIAAAIWIAIAHWFQGSPKSEYPGVALIISNSLIFISAMIYRFAKPQDEFS
jgi:hypothetical protein